MLIHRLMNRFLGVSENKAWQVFAGTGIGAFLGLVVMLKSRSASNWALSIGGGAVLGLVSALMLVWADSHRGRKGSDHISPAVGALIVLGFFGLVALIIFVAFLVMTN
jgi:hypothetical protein